MKANMDLKNPKRCGGILHKDLWKMLHPKFIWLFCVPHYFPNIVSLLFSWCDQIIIIFLFQTFLFWWIFFLLVNHLSNKSANIMSTVGERVTLVQSFGIKTFARLGLKGVTKDNILCFMIKKHGHTSFPKHDYFLFQEILTQERIWFMLQFVPCSYSCLSFFKPPFQVFSLADIFYLLFSC